jgi:hypothetical protein
MVARVHCPSKRLTAVLLAVSLLAGGTAVAGSAPRMGVDSATGPAGASAVSAAKRPFLRLARLGVKPSGAILAGRTLTLRLKAKRKVKVQLAVVEGKRVRASARTFSLKRGTRTITKQLNRIPQGVRLRLRVTAKLGRKQGRKVMALKILPPPSNGAPGGGAPGSGGLPGGGGGTPPEPTNSPPSSLDLSGSTVAENEPAGTAVGSLSATDPDSGDILTFSLVSGAGGEDNASFEIEGDSLRTAEPLDFEAGGSRTVRVRASDGKGGTVEKQFTITVADVFDPAVILSGSTVAENQPPGTSVGTLSTSEGSGHSYALVPGEGGEDNDKFQITGNALTTAATLDFEAGSTRSIRVRSTDSDARTVEQQLTIAVTDANDLPVADDETLNGADRAVGNTTLVGNDPSDPAPTPAGPRKTVTADLLAGDSDQDAGASLSVGPGTFPTNDGGTVTLEQDGDFTYHPAAGTSCADNSDFFDYTLSDGQGTDTGRVTITLADCVWYADASAPAGGSGRSHAPFNSLAPLRGAGDADAAGSTLFLYDGSYSAGLPLENGQALFSQRHGLVVPDGGGGNLTLEPAVPAGPTTTIAGGLALAANNTIQGIHLGAHSGAALSGTNVGAAAMNTATSGAIDNPSGQAVSIATGALDMAFTAVTSTGSPSAGISLGNTSGTFTANGGTLQNAAGPDVALSGGSVDFTYDGTINDDAGPLISVTNQTGGTKDFNGAIGDGGDGDGAGISLTNNGGATIRFDGGLTLSTGAAPALTATGGGTLAIPDPAGAPVNTLETTTGTALNVANTAVASSDLVFQRVASNGAASAVVLNNTGSSGGLSVTGDGSAGSGGQIQSSTGPGMSLTGVGGGVDLARMAVAGGGDDGIRATGVGGGLTLANSTVSNNGNAVGERGLDLTNVTGSSSITSTTVTGSAETNARIANDAGTSSLSVTGSTFSSNSTTLGTHGLEIRGDATATINAGVTGSTFSANRDNAFQLSNGGGSPTMNLRFNGNTVTGGNASMLSGQPGIVVAPTAGAQTKVEIDDNQVSGTLGRAIVVNPLPGSTSSAQFDATVTDNTIGTGAAFSGSAQGEGMVARGAGDGDSRFAIRNNLIRNYAQIGLWLRSQEGSGGTGNADYTVTGNTISNPSGSGFEGIFVSSGAASGDNMTVCADIGGATAALENTFDAAGTGGVDDIAFSRRFLTDLRLPGYTTGGDLTTYVRGRNNGTPTVANYDLALTGQPGACAQPALPPS